MATTMAMFERFGAMKMWSFVHELGDEEEDNPTPYEHTHVFVWYVKCLDITNSRAFDVPYQILDVVQPHIHPNIQNKRGIDWAKTIVLAYHKGKKTKACGKKYFIEPEFLEQFGVEEWRMEEDMFKIALAAPTLVDACLDLGMYPKSISDLNLLRKCGKKRDFDYPHHTTIPEKLKDLPSWNREDKCLVMTGKAGSGKTEWALSQGKKVHMITTMDDLKNVRDDCDLLVFDEMLFHGNSKFKQDKTGMIALLDRRHPRRIHTRYFNPMIPCCPKIFLCNEHESVFGKDPESGGHDGPGSLRAISYSSRLKIHIALSRVVIFKLEKLPRHQIRNASNPYTACVFGCCPHACHACYCAHPCSCFCFCVTFCCCWWICRRCCGPRLDIWGA